ncbi:MAG: hybrid sensor histidine kinase/response regulator [Cyanobacteria bacterium]|nr:hybrid sensor histidine kinase/response regulator [Cyanobacteriota bacterium]
MNSPPSILIVDDEPTNFDVIEALLANEDYQLHYAPNGQRAMDRLELFQPDAILLDVMMPGISGIDVCRQIKAMEPWKMVPILMVTALTSKDDLATCLAAGADDFVSKPVNGVELRARLRSMLRIKQQQDQLQERLDSQRQTVDLLQNNLEALRGNVARALPHELNTPLNGMLGLLDLLLLDHGEMDAAEMEEMLQDLKVSTCRLERLTRRFLTYVQLQLMAASPEDWARSRRGPGEAEVGPVVARVIDELGAVAQGDRVVVDLEPARVALSDYHLGLLVEELLDNGLKFSIARSPVKVWGHVKDDGFHLGISNHGRGFQPEQLRAIGSLMQFDRKQFEQQGMGLGLAIAFEITKLYGGSYWIDSIPDQETTVVLRLPLPLRGDLSVEQ